MLGDYPPGIHDIDINNEPKQDFNEWLQDPTSEIQTIFENDLFEQAPEIYQIALKAINSTYQNTRHGNQIWTAYWDLYNEWVENYISKDARKELEALWEESE